MLNAMSWRGQEAFTWTCCVEVVFVVVELKHRRDR